MPPRVTKRGGDGLVHYAYGEGFTMAICSEGVGGNSGTYIVDTSEVVPGGHVTCLWCLVEKETSARIY